MRILIVDDEPLARERLRGLLEAVAGTATDAAIEVEVVAEAGDGRAAVEAAARHAPDLVLLDIAMPVMDGLEAARHLAAQHPAPAVVFCTAYDEHALAAFEADAIDYLLKPVRRERLAQALEKAARMGPKPPPPTGGAPRSHLCARLRGNLRLIPVEEVHYFHAEEKYVLVRHDGGEDLIEDSLKTLEGEFGERFLRVHRACLIAGDRLAELRRAPDGGLLAVLHGGGETLEVSRRCAPALRRHMRGKR